METDLTTNGLRLSLNYIKGISKGFEMDLEQASIIQCFVWDYEKGFFNRYAKEYYIAKTYLERNKGCWKG